MLTFPYPERIPNVLAALHKTLVDAGNVFHNFKHYIKTKTGGQNQPTKNFFHLLMHHLLFIKCGKKFCLFARKHKTFQIQRFSSMFLSTMSPLAHQQISCQKHSSLSALSVQSSVMSN